MPKLIERQDWSRTVSSFGNYARVWQEDVSGDSTVVPLALPELGSYRVLLVKVDESVSPRRSARDLIGYGRKYGGEPRTAEDWLHEIREGDES